MKKYLLPIVTFVCLTIGLFLGNALSQKVNAQQRGYLFPPNKIEHIMQLLSTRYVEELNTDTIIEQVATDIVKQLDPHSSYIPKEDLELVNSELEGSFSGIGVQFSIQEDTVGIVAIISGGPSEKIGILAGDKIIEVNDSVFTGKGINNEKVMHTLRGPKGTEVRLGIKRDGEDEMLHFTIERGDVPVRSIDTHFIISDEIGYVRVNKFAANTYSEFMLAMADLRYKGAQSYIIDLRGNSGGYMDQAIKMANEFLQDNDLIVYSLGRAYPYYESRANKLGRFHNEDIVVLMDAFSASASEIFAGAIQDNDRGTIIGKRSFGKGLVQQQFPLYDGSALRLTVAKYYTPSGRCIQKPYELGKGEDYYKDMLERIERGELYNEDSIPHADSLIFHTKKGRTVYGGGGIIPDIFVANDTTLNSPWYNKTVNRGYTYQFAYQYTNHHRKELERYESWSAMEAYLLKQNLVEQYAEFCEGKGIEREEEQIKKSTPLISRLLIVYIVRDMLGDDDFYILFERDDEVTQKAVDFLQQANNDKKKKNK